MPARSSSNATTRRAFVQLVHPPHEPAPLLERSVDLRPGEVLRQVSGGLVLLVLLLAKVVLRHPRLVQRMRELLLGLRRRVQVGVVRPRGDLQVNFTSTSKVY